MEGSGYRGYISSRPFGDERAPQHVQNIIIRTYCDDLGLPFLLSATEVAMPDTFMMLEQLMRGIRSIEGIVFYSLLQLPEGMDARNRIYTTVLENRRSLHFAVEGMQLSDHTSAAQAEDVFGLLQVLPYAFNPQDLS